MKKYVAFDIGDVLCHCFEDKFLNAVSESANISIDESLRFFKRFWEHHDLGFTTIEDELKDKLHINSEVTINKINDCWMDTLKANDIMLEYLVNLMFIDKSLSTNVRTNVQVALLSNIGKEHASKLKNTFDDLLWNGYGTYDACVKHLSFEVGARKPSLIYYQSFLQMHPEFKGCVYVDDREENLITAEKLGFKSFKFSLKNYTKNHTISTNDEYKLKDKLIELKKLILE
jgi:FMN phosphatase YigB (HAD superfamily)